MNLKYTRRISFMLILILVLAFAFTSCASEELVNEIDRLNKRITELEEKNSALEDEYQDILKRVDLLESGLGDLISPDETFGNRPILQGGKPVIFGGSKDKKK